MAELSRKGACRFTCDVDGPAGKLFHGWFPPERGAPGDPGSVRRRVVWVSVWKIGPKRASFDLKTHRTLDISEQRPRGRSQRQERVDHPLDRRAKVMLAGSEALRTVGSAGREVGSSSSASVSVPGRDICIDQYIITSQSSIFRPKQLRRSPALTR
jgi:hypothetical protein